MFHGCLLRPDQTLMAGNASGKQACCSASATKHLGTGVRHPPTCRYLLSELPSAPLTVRTLSASPCKKGRAHQEGQ